MKKSKLSECDILEPLCISHLQLEKLSLLNSINGPLSDEALKQLSNVCSLSVSLSRPRVSMKSNFLHSMLENLPSITELELSWTGPLAEYVKILPSDLTSLDLINTRLSDVDVQLLSDSSGKTLKHLGLVLCSGITEIILKRLPKQFPFLQTLDLSGCRLLKPDLLFGLVKLAFLKEIVISDNPHLTDVIMKQFRTLTDNRVHVAQKNKRNCNRCDCIFYSQSLS
ncbi:F-box/LRR-repeat protein 15 isoform X3 [Heptranchias perlo]